MVYLHRPKSVTKVNGQAEMYQHAMQVHYIFSFHIPIDFNGRFWVLKTAQNHLVK